MTKKLPESPHPKWRGKQISQRNDPLADGLSYLDSLKAMQIKRKSFPNKKVFSRIAAVQEALGERGAYRQEILWDHRQQTFCVL